MDVLIANETEAWVREMVAKGTFETSGDVVEFCMSMFKALCEQMTVNQTTLAAGLKEKGLLITFPLVWNEYWESQTSQMDMSKATSNMQRAVNGEMEQVMKEIEQGQEVEKQLFLSTGTGIEIKEEGVGDGSS